MVVLSELSEASSSSSSTHAHRYDVFLSFRGLDTRHSFTNHLHKALMDANIATFLDDEEIETGEDLKLELESAIKASRASVIVLSKNYATSRWCLDELVLILEQRKASNHVVIPIFYHVEPTHVRKQQSSFGDAMAKHRQMIEAETNEIKRYKWAQKMDRWKKALMEVADLKGKDVNGRLETELIEEIVKDIYGRFCISSRSHLPQLYGMDYSIEFVTSWLKDASSNTANILTILGMGGIGKTSLAKYVYALHSHEFDRSSFIEDISRRCDEKYHGLLDLQKQLCDGISKPSPNQLHDASIYTSMIEKAVARKKVLLVLDDINCIDQLNALLGSKDFHPRSKIIITTKDAWLTESCELFKRNIKPMHSKHKLQVLCEIESQKLLCFHAFMCNHPKAGYEELSEKLVKYCEGHPMALKVLGKSLHNRDVAYWEGYIDKLKKENRSPVNNILRMSYDTLPFKDDKELFKHIACFFVGMDIDETLTILDACDIETRNGITNLIDRYLLSIGWNNKLMMHQLVQEMGRFVVREESPAKPHKRSRLWSYEAFKVLKQKKGTDSVLGLTLDMRMLEKEKLRGSCELKTDALTKMDSLMLLQLNYVHIDGSYDNFPEELRWLCMHGFPKKSIPTYLPMENLVAFDMSYSNIESFDLFYSNSDWIQNRQEQLDGSCSKDKRLLGSLKILNLSFSQQLRTVGCFDQLPALERLILTNCIALLEVCDSIGQCAELVLIDLRYCNKLEKLPRSLGMLKKVKTLLLDGCNLGESQIEIKEMDSHSPEMLKPKIPSDSKFFAISLPRSLVRLSLANNNLSTKSFPLDFSWLSMLKELCLDENPIVSLPSCVKSLPRLEVLSMMKSKGLRSIEHPPHTLTNLYVKSGSHKPLIRKVLFDPEMSPLKFLIDWDIFRPSSFEFEGLIKIQPMADVDETILRTLGWIKLDFLNGKHVGTYDEDEGYEKFKIQMYYEFGIFSTIYGGEEMPNWITEKNNGPSISLTIPSSPNKLRGLNFCCVQTPLIQKERFGCVDEDFLDLPTIIVRNITKNRTWIYIHYIERVDVTGECLTLLSHWMFGKSEMECGDHITISVAFHVDKQVTKECGVSFVYDDGEEDVLGYYKSWNHIIGRDLTAFQLTTGEYILNNIRFLLPGIQINNYLLYEHLFGHDAHFKYEHVQFRAFSQRKSGVP